MVLIFKEEEETEIELPLTEEEIQDKYDGKIKKEMSGKTYEVITDLFRAVTGRKPIAPKDFLGNSGTPAVTCSHKAASGFLYPLDKGMIYIYKPPIYLRYDEMQRVEFDRTGGSSRSFDVKVTNIHDITYTFSSIEKGEYSKLYDYLKSKKVKISGGTAGGTCGAEPACSRQLCCPPCWGPSGPHTCPGSSLRCPASVCPARSSSVETCWSSGPPGSPPG